MAEFAELQEEYKIRYKGRKGRKKLQEIENSIAGLRREMGNMYDDYEEMHRMNELTPDPVVRLYFLKMLKELDGFWGGVETYGLLRLCGKWCRQKQVEQLNQPEVDLMMESLLPSQEWKMLTQEGES